MREFLRGRLVAGWSHSEHIDNLDEYLSSLKESQRRFAYIGTLAWERSRRGFEDVIRWVEAVPDEPASYKEAVFLKAATTLAGIDGPRTAAWMEGQLGRAYSAGGLAVLARTWGVQDPAAHLAWLAGQSEGAARNGAVSKAFGTWLDRDGAAAPQWLLGATPEPALDPALGVMVGRATSERPERAMIWAMAIDSRPLRQRTLLQVGRDWLERDPRAAEEWLKQSEVPRQVVRAILEPTRPDPSDQGVAGAPSAAP
jgi:hypothetical protein